MVFNVSVSIFLFCYIDGEIKVAKPKGINLPFLKFGLSESSGTDLNGAVHSFLSSKNILAREINQLKTRISKDKKTINVDYFAIINQEINHETIWESVIEDDSDATKELISLSWRTHISSKFLDNVFTITELRLVTESLIGEKLNNSRYRDRIEKAELLKAIPGKKIIEGKGKPAQLYKINPSFYGNFYCKSLTKAT